MKPISSSELTPLKMKIVGGEAVQKFNTPSNKIGWIHSLSDKPGASFSIVIRDAMGRVMFERPNCSAETREFGQLINLDTRLGEEVEVSLENVKGADEISIFLN